MIDLGVNLLYIGFWSSHGVMLKTRSEFKCNVKLCERSGDLSRKFCHCMKVHRTYWLSDFNSFEWLVKVSKVRCVSGQTKCFINGKR